MKNKALVRKEYVYVSRAIRGAALFSTKLAAKLSFFVYFVPVKSRRRVSSIKGLPAPSVTQVAMSNTSVNFYRWGVGPNVLFSHGWSGYGAQWKNFVQPLLDAGFSVTLFDAPAHGENKQLATDTLEVASCIKSYVDSAKDVTCIVGHSYGGLASLYAINQGATVDGIVCISLPDPNVVLSKFLTVLKVPAQVAEIHRSSLESKYRALGLDVWNDFRIDTLRSNASLPSLLVQDRDDEEISDFEAAEVRNQFGPSQTLITDGFGHYRFMYSDELVATVTRFVSQLEVESSPCSATVIPAAL